MRAGDNLATHRMVGTGPKDTVRRIVRGAQQPARGAVRKGGLTDALEPGQQPGVVQAAAPAAGLERLLGPLMAGQVEDLAWVMEISPA